MQSPLTTVLQNPRVVSVKLQSDFPGSASAATPRASSLLAEDDTKWESSADLVFFGQQCRRHVQVFMLHPVGEFPIKMHQMGYIQSLFEEPIGIKALRLIPVIGISTNCPCIHNYLGFHRLHQLWRVYYAIFAMVTLLRMNVEGNKGLLEVVEVIRRYVVMVVPESKPAKGMWLVDSETQDPSKMYSQDG
ncbi:hypothetical protein L3X38_024263 [Prunus dulcis]|uniref:Uncharacterized protein n=1 Tax=Prunus dulcis TaxID=3755 RepID=A0AAD4VZF7_PRUDU|nr:hypothetical protein L3X38_024263 [Prunus dulcis]